MISYEVRYVLCDRGRRHTRKSSKSRGSRCTGACIAAKKAAGKRRVLPGPLPTMRWEN